MSKGMLIVALLIAVAPPLTVERAAADEGSMRTSRQCAGERFGSVSIGVSCIAETVPSCSMAGITATGR